MKLTRIRKFQQMKCGQDSGATHWGNDNTVGVNSLWLSTNVDNGDEGN